MSIFDPPRDDLLAKHPSELRAEIKRLRVFEGAATMLTIQEAAEAVLCRHLCMLRGTECACACPGACVDEARIVLQELRDAGLAIVRIEP